MNYLNIFLRSDSFCILNGEDRDDVGDQLWRLPDHKKSVLLHMLHSSHLHHGRNHLSLFQNTPSTLEKRAQSLLAGIKIYCTRTGAELYFAASFFILQFIPPPPTSSLKTTSPPSSAGLYF